MFSNYSMFSLYIRPIQVSRLFSRDSFSISFLWNSHSSISFFLVTIVCCCLRLIINSFKWPQKEREARARETISKVECFTYEQLNYGSKCSGANVRGLSFESFSFQRISRSIIERICSLAIRSIQKLQLRRKRNAVLNAERQWFCSNRNNNSNNLLVLQEEFERVY